MTVALMQTPGARSFVQLTEALPQVMAAVKGVDGRYAYANSGFCHRLGLHRDQILGRTVHELFARDLAASYARQDEAVVRTLVPLSGQLELIVRADGRLGWYMTSKAVLAADGDPCVGVAVLSVDLNSQVTSGHAGLAAVIAAVRADVSAPWRLPGLARLAGLSPSQLQRRCRGTLGISPQRLVQRIRLEEAVRLAIATDRSFGEIAADCGFYDQASFTRQFRSVLGLTPTAYRRAARSDIIGASRRSRH
ncbi:MAG: AraC family transcriptional regulator [Actinomycetota bacterium]|nr:AraC family transcriptional regulator [Actinomycetota bacterium]